MYLLWEWRPFNCMSWYFEHLQMIVQVFNITLLCPVTIDHRDGLCQNSLIYSAISSWYQWICCDSGSPDWKHVTSRPIARIDFVEVQDPPKVDLLDLKGGLFAPQPHIPPTKSPIFGPLCGLKWTFFADLGWCVVAPLTLLGYGPPDKLHKRMEFCARGRLCNSLSLFALKTVRFTKLPYLTYDATSIAGIANFAAKCSTVICNNKILEIRLHCLKPQSTQP